MAESNASKATNPGRVALITGANTGIGLVTARELCAQGFHVFVACRSAGTGQAAINTIQKAVPGAQVELLSLDLGDFASCLNWRICCIN